MKLRIAATVLRMAIFIVLILHAAAVLAQVRLYSECNYHGRVVTLQPGNFYSAEQAGIRNTRTQSIVVPAGYRVELYSEYDLSGRAFVATSNQSCLGSNVPAFVQSIRVVYSGANNGNATNQNVVRLHASCNFSGTHYLLPPGEYPTLRNTIGNNALSSFQIPEGMVLEIFEQDNFGGASTGPISIDNVCLNGAWNNRASSAKVYYRSNGDWHPPVQPPIESNENVVQVFPSCNYMGQAFTFRPGDYNNLPRDMDNRSPSSIRIPQGMTVTFYSQTNLNGGVLGKYTANNACMSYLVQFSGRSMRITGSAEPPSGPGPGTSIAVYDRCYYSGKHVNLGVGRFASLANIGGLSPASMIVPRGYAITLYQGRNFTGASSGRITSNNTCLSSAFNGRTGSIVVEYTGATAEQPIDREEGISIYQDCGYRGANRKLMSGNYASSASFGVSIAALRIPQGYEVQLFTGSNFTGQSSGRLTANNQCLSASFRNRVKSIRVTYYGRAPRTELLDE